MKKNMGLVDRITRTAIAIVLITLFFSGIIHGMTGILLTVLAGIFLLTSATGFCPLYLPFGFNTCKR